MDEAPRRSAPPRNDDVISQERFERYHRFAREQGHQPRPLLPRARDPRPGLPRLLPPPALGPRARPLQGRADRRLQPPQLPRPVRDRRLPALAPPAAVRRQGRAVREALAGLVPVPARRLPDPPRPVRRDRDGDRPADRRARRHRGHLPRGHAASAPARSAARSAASAGSRWRPARRCCRSPSRAREEVRRGWRIRPRKVKLRAGKPLTFPRTERPSPALAATVTDRIWPNIELQWEWLGGLPPLRKAAVIGAGSWGTAVAVAARPRRARGRARHAHRGEGRADRPQARERGVPAGGEAARGPRRQARDRDRARRLRPDLPRGPVVGAAERGRRARRPDRLARLGAAALEGLRAADGRAAERVRLRARPRPRDRLPRRPGARARGGRRDGGAGARQLPTPTCGRCSARSSTAPAWSASAPTTSPGSRSPAPAKNAAALAAAAAERFGLNAAGIAAAGVWRECVEFALARGGRLETFSGLAGVGDLTATVLAPKSRNRQAGELLGAGRSGGEDPGPDRPGLGGRSTRCR